MDATHTDQATAGREPAKSGRGLTLTLKTDPDLPASVAGKECTMIAIGELDGFLAGQRGVLVRFKDQTIRYRGGRPEGSFYLHHFADRDVAVAHAEAVWGQPIGLIGRKGGEFLTNRGTFSVQPIQWADGGKSPRLGLEDWRGICTLIEELFQPSADSEGNRV